MSTLRDWLNENTNVGVPADKIRKFRPMYREVVKQKTGLKGTKLEKYVNQTMPRNSSEIFKRFSTVRTPEEANDAIAKMIVEEGPKIDADLATYNTLTRDALVDDDDERTTSGLQLRQRFKLPGNDDAVEPVNLAVSDVVQSDLFGWKTTNEETGLFNSVHLDNKQNEYINTRQVGVPRPPVNLERLVLPFQAPSQYDDQQDVESELSEMARDEVVAAILRYGPPHSVGLHDQSMLTDPFGLTKPQATFMMNVNSLEPGMMRDYTQGTDLGQLDAIGMRSTLATWRDPLRRESQQYVPPYDPRLMIDKMQRFDYLF